MYPGGISTPEAYQTRWYILHWAKRRRLGHAVYARVLLAKYSIIFLCAKAWFEPTKQKTGVKKYLAASWPRRNQEKQGVPKNTNRPAAVDMINGVCVFGRLSRYPAKRMLLNRDFNTAVMPEKAELWEKGQLGDTIWLHVFAERLELIRELREMLFSDGSPQNICRIHLRVTKRF